MAQQKAKDQIEDALNKIKSQPNNPENLNYNQGAVTALKWCLGEISDKEFYSIGEPDPKEKLILALGIISGRIQLNNLNDYNLYLLGIDSSKLNMLNFLKHDELKQSAELIIMEHICGN